MHSPVDSLERHPMLRIHPESLATIVDQVPPVPPWVGVQLQQHKNGMFDVCLTWTGWLTYLMLFGDIFPVFFSLLTVLKDDQTLMLE